MVHTASWAGRPQGHSMREYPFDRSDFAQCLSRILGSVLDKNRRRTVGPCRAAGRPETDGRLGPSADAGLRRARQAVFRYDLSGRHKYKSGGAIPLDGLAFEITPLPSTPSRPRQIETWYRARLISIIDRRPRASGLCVSIAFFWRLPRVPRRRKLDRRSPSRNSPLVTCLNQCVSFGST